MSRTRIAAATAFALLVASAACYGVEGLSSGTDAADGSAPPVQIVARPDGGTCACLGAGPAGWQGPAALATGTTAAPPCGGDYLAEAFQAFGDLNAPPAQCGCTCTASGISCPSTFPVDLYTTSNCNGGVASKCDTVTVAPGACVNVQSNCAVANGIGPAPAPQGTCTAHPTTSVPTWSWGHTTRACELPMPPQQETCGAGEQCIPIPAAPMEARPCILQAGDLACPAGPYTVRRLLYGGATDNRGCTTCSCSVTGTCTTTVSLGCAIITPLAFTTCGSLGDPGSIKLTGTPQADASCPPTGGQAEGAVTPKAPTTVCCLP